MHGTPTHRRFEVLPEPVELAVAFALHDVAPAAQPELAAAVGLHDGAPAAQPELARDTEQYEAAEDATR